MKYLGKRDLHKRWTYTRQGLDGLVKQPYFPKPSLELNLGHTQAWSEDDILAFEKAHPEVLYHYAKRAKVASYYRGIQKKKQGIS